MSSSSPASGTGTSFGSVGISSSVGGGVSLREGSLMGGVAE
jgi:hypothetical protein